MPTYFIAGASRGIGLELAKQLSDDQNNTVIASYRSSAPELLELAKKSNVSTVVLDVDDQSSIEKLPEQLGDIAIDVAIMNAGIARSFSPVANTPRHQWIDHFVTNAVGPAMVFQQIQSLVEKAPSPKAYFVSTAAGSIQTSLPVSTSAYGASKAALNFIVRKLSEEVPKITFVALHPGMVATDMGMFAVDILSAGNDEIKSMLEGVSITPELSASQIIAAINAPIKSGRFIRVDDRLDIPF
ncbi:hypothetical protein OGAPHI_001692 [Ogataea philodendri]|uniref:Uncharacterized protein n=1 Tax=Ogataea philodendri TaxID=1378263 RepID=A0A9P8T6C2_9ASCO|nr:uncharacterized protein OGAPHI_001692 [Ogataea philodendri]KAH3667938.1 hypothetical protein OGAPHI_001692 [Ogataea philodendri]